MAKGSSSTSTTKSDINVTTNTVIQTDKLAKAIEEATKAEITNAQAQIMLESAKTKAELTQKQALFNKFENDMKQAGKVAIGGFIAYKLFFQKSTKRKSKK